VGSSSPVDAEGSLLSMEQSEEMGGFSQPVSKSGDIALQKQVFESFETQANKIAESTL